MGTHSALVGVPAKKSREWLVYCGMTNAAACGLRDFMGFTTLMGTGLSASMMMFMCSLRARDSGVRLAVAGVRALERVCRVRVRVSVRANNLLNSRFFFS